jgi:shikimate kinase
MDYAMTLFHNDSDFWTDDTILNLNYGKVYFRDNIKTDIENIATKIQNLKDSGQSTHGEERKSRKTVFNSRQPFFELLFKHWIRNNENSEDVNKFYQQLNIMFKKVAEFYGINPKEWNIE